MTVEKLRAWGITMLGRLWNAFLRRQISVKRREAPTLFHSALELEQRVLLSSLPLDWAGSPSTADSHYAHAPIVIDQRFTLAENAVNGTVVGQVSFSDVEHQIVQLSITHGNFEDAFSIDASGVIRVNNQEALNFEATPTLTLIVTALDSGSPQRFGSGTIQIDLEDRIETGVLFIDANSGETILATSEGYHLAFQSGPDWAGLGEVTHTFAADVSGDGLPDVIGVNRQRDVYVSLRAASGFQAPVLWGTIPLGHLHSDLNVGDFNGDGLADLVSRGETGHWWIQRSTGNAFQEIQGPLWSVSGWKDGEALVGDFNGDGKDDIALRQQVQIGYTTAQWYFALGTETGLLTTYAGAWNESSYTWQDLRVGDFNGDGRDDIAARMNLGGWFALQMSSGDRLQMRRMGKWSPTYTWKDVSVGDFNGDGKDDIVGWEQRGLWWALEGAETLSPIKHYGAWSATADWRATVGDMNGDGRDDVIGFAGNTGAAWGLISNGTKFSPTDFLGYTVPSSNWKLLTAVEPPKPPTAAAGTSDVITLTSTGTYGPFQLSTTTTDVADDDAFLINLNSISQPRLELSFPPSNDTAYDATHYTLSDHRYIVNPYEQYRLLGTTQAVPTYYEDSLGFYSFDIDGNQILPEHVTRFSTALDTTLAAPLSPGDLSIYLSDATGWSNELWQPARSRSLAWYGYQDSTGRTYEDFTYTRNVATDFDHGLWDDGAITFDADTGFWKIDLNQPWAGPVLVAGSAVRNADGGNRVSGGVKLSEPERTEERFNESNKRVPGGQPFVELSSTFGDVWVDGIADQSKFMPGTFSIQPVVVAPEAWHKLQLDIIENSTNSSNISPDAQHQLVFEIDVLANDVPASEIANYTITSITGTPYGEVNPIAGGGASGQDVINYRSPAYFAGTDSFTYTARHNETGNTITSTVKVHILGDNLAAIPTLESEINARIAAAGSNIAPVAFDDGLQEEYSVRTGETLTTSLRNPAVTLNDGDQDGDTIAAELITPPAHGQLNFLPDGTFEYTPDADYVGKDSFRYRITDGLDSEPATVQLVIHAADQQQARENLRDIVIGLYNYHDVHNRFPARDSNPTEHDPGTGWSYLSWRVQILPYLGYQELYNQFHLDEPWDSPHNLSLLDQMPDVFRSAGDAGDSTTTRMQIFRNVGDEYYWNALSTRNGAGFVINIVGSRYRDFTDDVKNTALVIEVGTDKAVPWTQPDQDVLLDPDNALASLGDLPSGLINMVLANGTVMTLSTNITDAELTALATLRGGELVNAETLQRREALNPLVAQVLDGDSVEHTERNLKRLGLGLHNYHDIFSRFPISDSPYWYDADGRPFLSWRVHLLPYIGERQLYDQFHLDEPWDSPHNLPLMQYMPDIFRSSGDAYDSTTTRMQTFNGPEALFEAKLGPINTNSTQRQGYIGPQFRDIKDGTENTILVAEVGADRAVPWTKPQDVDFDINDPLAGLGAVDGEMRVLNADGAVGTIDIQISPEQFAAFVTPDVSRIYASSGVPGEELVSMSSYFNRTTTERNELKGLYDEAQRRAQINKAKGIGLGLHNYHDIFQQMAVTNNYRYYDDNGVPYLSWRVHLLPWLGYANLYNQFNLEEPWDSHNNVELIKYMPDIYRSIGDAWDSMTTRFQTFFGEAAAWGKRRSLDYSGSGPGTGYTGPRLRDITDGSSNTIAIVEAGRDKAVIWTKPEDIPFDPANPFAHLGDIDNDFLALFFDGAARRLSKNMDPAGLAALITPDGGETVSSFDQVIDRTEAVSQADRSTPPPIESSDPENFVFWWLSEARNSPPLFGSDETIESS